MDQPLSITNFPPPSSHAAYHHPIQDPFTLLLLKFTGPQGTSLYLLHPAKALTLLGP